MFYFYTEVESELACKLLFFSLLFQSVFLRLFLLFKHFIVLLLSGEVPIIKLVICFFISVILSGVILCIEYLNFTRLPLSTKNFLNDSKDDDFCVCVNTSSILSSITIPNPICNNKYKEIGSTASDSIYTLLIICEL